MKSGLDWFRLDCLLDDNFELVVAEFGAKGFETLVRLYQKIYQDKGYYCHWNHDVALLFSPKLRLGVDVVEEIVKAAIRRNLFNAELFKKHSILTSHGIQKWYFDCAGRRTGVNAVKEFLLLNDAEIKDNVNILSKNVNINAKNADSFKHSTEQDSTLHNSERVIPSDGNSRNKFIPPTLGEITAYCKDRNNAVEPKRFLDYFTASNWIDSKGNKVLNWKQKVITWEQSGANKPAKPSDKKQDIISKDFDADSLNAQFDKLNGDLL